MDQVKIGEFISNSRKELGLTQKELSEKLGVSDKTISRWETGNGLPDISFLTPLCEILGVSINELLSGERLPITSYPQKAEENILELLKENHENKKPGRIQFILGVALIILTIVFMNLSFTGGKSSGTWFFDVPSILILVVSCVACVFISGSRGAKNIVVCLRKIILPIGCIFTLISFVVILGQVSDLSVMGQCLSIGLLCLLYSFIGYVALRVIEIKLEK